MPPSQSYRGALLMLIGGKQCAAARTALEIDRQPARKSTGGAPPQSAPRIAHRDDHDMPDESPPGGQKVKRAGGICYIFFR